MIPRPKIGPLRSRYWQLNEDVTVWCRMRTAGDGRRWPSWHVSSWVSVGNEEFPVSEEIPRRWARQMLEAAFCGGEVAA